MATGMICQSCGVEAPTKYVEFYQNIGALVIRFHKGIKGNLCKRCIHKYFWSYTATNLTLGWWGYISLFMTPVFTINNIIRYAGAAGLPRTEPDARPPALTPDVASKLNPMARQIMSRLQSREPVEEVAKDVARRTGVTPGQVLKYVIELSKQRRPGIEGAYGVAMPSSARKTAPDLAPIPLEGEDEESE